MKNLLQLLVIVILTSFSISMYANDMSDKELIKGRKAMFKQNYSYAKKMSSEITKGNNQGVSLLIHQQSHNLLRTGQRFLVRMFVLLFHGMI